MRISVIIPALNEAAHLGACLRSARQAGADEIIVVDGGSTDDTVALASGATVIHSAAGRARQQNAGAQAATGDVLLFLHADNALSGKALEPLRAALLDDRVLWGAFEQRIEAQGFAYRALEYGNALRVRRRGLAYGDQGIWVRRGPFADAGGFAGVPLLEDLLLSQALRRYARPRLLPGPLLVSARRWQRHGVLRQTMRNWGILAAHACGASPDELARRYRRHDK